MVEVGLMVVVLLTGCGEVKQAEETPGWMMGKGMPYEKPPGGTDGNGMSTRSVKDKNRTTSGVVNLDLDLGSSRHVDGPGVGAGGDP